MEAKKNSFNRIKIIAVILLVVLYNAAIIYISYKNSSKGVVYVPESYEYTVPEGQSFTIPLKLKNNTAEDFLKDEKCFLSYHLYDASENLIQWDYCRSEFSKDILKGHNSEEAVNIEPLNAGAYIIKLDVVKEGVKWFSEEYAESKAIKITVTGK